MNKTQLTTTLLVVLTYSTVANPTNDEITTYHATSINEATSLVMQMVNEGQELYHVTIKK